MYLDLPVEQLVRREGMLFQFAFATEARELVPEREEYLLKASHKGLHVMAKNEDSLMLPIAEKARGGSVRGVRAFYVLRIALRGPAGGPARPAN